MNTPSNSSTDLAPRAAERGETISRRGLLRNAAGLAVASTFVASTRGRTAETRFDPQYKASAGRIKQSVCHWCFNPMSVEELAMNAAKMGILSVELVAPEHWPTLKKYGLICAIASSHGFTVGPNHRENHAYCLEKLRASIDAASAAGCPNVITFSGMRRGLADDVGLENMVLAMKKIMGHAEKKRVTICLEMLNTRDDTHPMKGHPDYMCDNIEWAIEVCDRVQSERMKILFDIYHVQIMQGDVIRRIRQHHEYIAHYHTAGVPGRGEIDERQELNYRPIMQAIAGTGYKGYVAQEFIPVDDKLQSLRQSAQICDV